MVEVTGEGQFCRGGDARANSEAQVGVDMARTVQKQGFPQHECVGYAKKLVMAGLCEQCLVGGKPGGSDGTGSRRSFCVPCCASWTLTTEASSYFLKQVYS